MYENFSESERELLQLSDDDHKRMIDEYREGQLFDLEFIRSLNLADSRRECFDYNDSVKLLRYYEEQVKSFTNYLDIMSGLMEDK